MSYEMFQKRRSEEIQANMEMARAVADTFSSFVRDVLHHELAVGISLTQPRPLSTADINRVLKANQAEHSGISYMHWINPQGIVTASTEAGAIGTTRFENSYFREMVAGRKWVLTELYISRITGKPVFAIARRVTDEKGVLQGIVTAGIDPEDLGRVISINRVGEGAVTLADKYGRGVYRSPSINWDWKKRDLLNRYPVLRTALAGKEVASTEIGLDGKVRILAASPVGSSGWIVIASRPEKEIITPIVWRVAGQVGLFLLVAGGSLLIALVISRTITNPIEELRKQVLAFGGGKGPKRVEEVGPTEVNDLTEAFNAMAGEINSREESLDRLRRHNELILNSAGEGIFGLDTDGRHTFVNPAAARMLGYEVNELLGGHSHAIWHRTKMDQRPFPEEECPIYAAYKDGIVHSSGDDMFWRKDGTSFPVEYTSTPIVEDGKLTGAVVTFRDIGECKQVEQRLQELYDFAPDMYFTISPDGTFTSVNLSGARQLGYEKDELIGKAFIEIIYADDRERVKSNVEAIFGKRTSTSELDFRKVRKDGSVLWVYERTQLVLDQDGGPEELRVVCRDITERKKLEEELLKIQKLESVGLLAGGIAHDFNNLLTAVLGNISLIKTSPDLDKRTLERLEQTELATLQAKQLTSQLLTFARGGEPVKKTVRIANLIREAATLSLRGSHVRCDFFISEDIWFVKVDQNQIAQVISNLVINAEEAMPEGGAIRVGAQNVTIEPESHIPLEPGRYVQLFVEDKGAGIPEKHLRNIFDPYFTTKAKGRGLGLAIVHSIVKKHGGYVEANCNAGAGTTFCVYLPAVEKDMVGIPGDTTRKSDVGPAEGSVSERKVLLMDDEPLVRNIGSEMMKYLGYEVDVAEDGTQAIDKYKEALTSGRPFDIIILDLTVPGGMGGKEAIKMLRAIDPEVNAIVSSGYSNDPIMAAFKEYGFKGVITKPYEITEIAEVLEKAVTGN